MFCNSPSHVNRNPGVQRPVFALNDVQEVHTVFFARKEVFVPSLDALCDMRVGLGERNEHVHWREICNLMRGQWR